MHMYHGINPEKADKWFKDNLPRYLVEHPRQLLCLTDDGSGGIEEVFLRTKEDVHQLDKYPKGQVFILKAIPKTLA